MRKTLDQLRSMAKLNMSEKCYQTYLSLIEPGVRELIITRFDDWRETESAITQMVMKHRGVFKTDMWIISLGEWREEYNEDVDRDLFNEIKKRPFKWKIDYLRKNNLLLESCYNLLDLARERRNNFHEHPLAYRFTEEDLDLFDLCHSVSANLQNLMRFNLPDDARARARSKG